MWRLNCMRIEGTTMTARELDGLGWGKSSFSPNGGSCAGVAWRKSSFSGNGGACVEVGWREMTTAVRDSKDDLGRALDFPVPEWRGVLPRPAPGRFSPFLP